MLDDGDASEGEVIAVLQVSPGRRWLGILMMAGLSIVLVYMASRVPFGAAQIGVIAIALLILWAAHRQHQATQIALELTLTELRVQGGSVLAKVDDMTRIDRGALAFKPSNGFLIHLRSRHPREWVPGVYWRARRRMGVGGVTSAGEAKYMAETIATLIATRDGDVD